MLLSRPLSQAWLDLVDVVLVVSVIDDVPHPHTDNQLPRCVEDDRRSNLIDIRDKDRGQCRSVVLEGIDIHSDRACVADPLT